MQRVLNLLIIFFLSVLSSISVAYSAEFSGLYAGTGIGGQANQIQVNSTTSLQFPSSAFFQQATSSALLSNNHALISIFTGYLIPISKLVIGPEAYINFGKLNYETYQAASALLPTESLTTATTGHLNNAQFGLDLRLGTILIQNSLFFARIGAAFDKYTNSSSATISRPLMPLGVTINNSFSDSITGLRLGLGLEQKINDKINFRIDYIFTHYPSTYGVSNTSPVEDEPFQLGPIGNNTSLQLKTNTLLASLVYHW